MFNFRLINTPDGNQTIDTTLKTPYDSITAIVMMEYIEVDNQLAYMEWMDVSIRCYLLGQAISEALNEIEEELEEEEED